MKCSVVVEVLIVVVVVLVVIGCFEAKLPTIWTDEKQAQPGRSRARKKQSQEETRAWRKSEERRSGSAKR